jgi:formate dehydrogenase subunit beta
MIPVENGDVLQAVREFLRKLMENGILEALLVPMETGNGAIIPGLVTDPDRLAAANPLAPVMPINNARAVAALTGKAAPATLGALLRPCELRALVELVKLQQATLEGVILIGIDCPGTFESVDYKEGWHADNGSLAGYLLAAKEGRDPSIGGPALRTACQICTQPVPENVAIHLHLFGSDITQGIPVTIWDQIAASLDLRETANTMPEYPKAVENLLAAHNQARERELAAIRAAITSDGGIGSLFETCIHCLSCKTACPICYCKTCLFETDAFRHEPAFYLRSAQQKGSIRLPADTLLYHLTRMNHMGLSCVGCGMCSSACPVHIPVASLFLSVASRVQQVFNYQPGRDAEEALPLISYQPSEWVEVGEER